MKELFSVKDTSTLESLVNIIMEEPGQIIELSQLAKELGSTRQTISTYLTYLEEAFVVRKLYNYSTNKRKIEKAKKYYPTIASPTLVFKTDDYSKSKVFEWLAVRELKPDFFWRDSYKNEVDIVLDENPAAPIEVKYGKISFDGLTAFMKKFGVKNARVISRDVEQKQKIGEKTIEIIPAYKLFLNKGKNSEHARQKQQKQAQVNKTVS